MCQEKLGDGLGRGFRRPRRESWGKNGTEIRFRRGQAKTPGALGAMSSPQTQQAMGFTPMSALSGDAGNRQISWTRVDSSLTGLGVLERAGVHGCGAELVSTFALKVFYELLICTAFTTH